MCRQPDGADVGQGNVVDVCCLLAILGERELAVGLVELDVVGPQL